MKVYFFRSHSKSLIKTLSNIEHYSFYYTIVLGRLSSFFVVDISRDGLVSGLIFLFMIIRVGSGQHILGQSQSQSWVKIESKYFFNFGSGQVAQFIRLS